MDIEQLPHAILFILASIVAGMALWYSGQRFGKRGLKLFGVAVVVLPVLAIGLNLLLPMIVGAPEYRTIAQGPDSRAVAAVTTSVMIPVTDSDLIQDLELTPKMRGAKPPVESLHLKYQVLSPKGEMLAQGELDAPATHDPKWAAVHVRFRTTLEGEHSLKLEIPAPASRVDILARELKK